MRISLPHMGNTYIAFKALFKRLDIEYVVPPKTSQRTLSLGVKYSPEGLCLPFKLTLGNLIEAAELGADTLIMPAGYGICRLGYYAKIQEQVLADLGFKNAEIVEVGVTEHKLTGLLRTIKRLANDAPWPKIISSFRFGILKLYAMDRIEQVVQTVRPVERVKGTANRLYADAIKAIDAADDARALKQAELTTPPVCTPSSVTCRTSRSLSASPASSTCSSSLSPASTWRASWASLASRSGGGSSSPGGRASASSTGSASARRPKYTRPPIRTSSGTSAATAGNRSGRRCCTPMSMMA